MKKIVSLMLCALMVFAVVACSSSASAKIEEYVESNKSELLSEMEKSFATSSGMTCTSDISVEGNGFIIRININELDNVDSAIKDQMQDAYDTMDSTFDLALTEMQKEIPELEYYEVVVCEKDGDELATIHAGK